MARALIVVDVQNDFCEGGALAVAGGAVVAAGITALDLVAQGDDLRARLFENTAYWRAGLERLGFDLLPGEHPIVPVMLGEARLAQEMAAREAMAVGD